MANSPTDAPVKPSGRTVRVAASRYERLAEISKKDDVPIGDVVARFLKAEDDRAFFAELDRVARELRADPVAWAEHEAEMALWDTTVGDGLEDE